VTAALTRRIGSSAVSAIGLGCAALSLKLATDPARGEAVIRAALDSGITLLDTATAYTTAASDNHNEQLIGRVLKGLPRAERPFISSKGGHGRRGEDFPIDARPASLRRDCEASLRALGVDVIDLYSLHWPDAAVPIEDSVGALWDLQSAGRIREIGVSNVTIDELHRALAVTSVASVQNRFSIFDPGDCAVVAECERVAITFMAYSPLGGSARRANPRTTHAADRVAAGHNVSAAQVALAWLLARSPAMIAIAGPTRPETARAAAAAMSLRLTDQDVRRLSATSC
jgi:aryl-alcohol dehydrogenase-like predicted oxidoreductase